MKKPKQYNIVRDFVIKDWYRKFTTRYVVEKLKITTTIAEQCFHFMNLEGLLSQACRPEFAEDHVDRPNYYIKTNKCEKLSGIQYNTSSNEVEGTLWYKKYN